MNKPKCCGEVVSNSVFGKEFFVCRGCKKEVSTNDDFSIGRVNFFHASLPLQPTSGYTPVQLVYGWGTACAGPGCIVPTCAKCRPTSVPSNPPPPGPNIIKGRQCHISSSCACGLESSSYSLASHHVQEWLRTLTVDGLIRTNSSTGFIMIDTSTGLLSISPTKQKLFETSPGDRSAWVQAYNLQYHP